jgi:hypothetical protein
MAAPEQCYHVFELPPHLIFSLQIIYFMMQLNQ